METQGVSQLRREAWDEAMLILLVEEPCGGVDLLAKIINEANDAMARLKERGMFDPDEDDEDTQREIDQNKDDPEWMA